MFVRLSDHFCFWVTLHWFKVPPLPPLCFRGGRLRQVSVLSQGGASGGQPQPFRAAGGQIQRGQGCLPGGHQKGHTHSYTGVTSLNGLGANKVWRQRLRASVSAGSLRIQDHFLRAGIHAAATGGQRVQLVPQLRRHRADVEGGLHHPKVCLTHTCPPPDPCAIFPHVNTHLSPAVGNRRLGSAPASPGRLKSS